MSPDIVGGTLVKLETAGVKIALAELSYAKDVANPQIFKEYRSIPAISDTTRSKDLVQYCKDIDAENPNGLREVYWPIAVQLNEEFAKWAVNYFHSVVPQISTVFGAACSCIPEFGENALGLDASNGPVHLLQVSCWWENAADDGTIY
ncbi:hypothetical protein NUU61_007450 [Penicillium alfredii]|uniref:Uncharacterized protein n=1 Tax=Penicillium alfredii TaxID=1506179 RepID=A0A9W9K4J8_9EURO|nr:uncharacterized protein NUU61_007450 [Penicillium alfredii]KAJ5092580.1 hypothetical protein NUU61_007450 [Penicillium alfredii]